jgi:hypothetical protein
MKINLDINVRGDAMEKNSHRSWSERVRCRGINTHRLPVRKKIVSIPQHDDDIVVFFYLEGGPLSDERVLQGIQEHREAGRSDGRIHDSLASEEGDDDASAIAWVCLERHEAQFLHAIWRWPVLETDYAAKPGGLVQGGESRIAPGPECKRAECEYGREA